MIQKAGELLKLFRVKNLVILFFTQLFVWYFLIQKNTVLDTLTPFLLLSFATVLITAAGYVINDYYDVKADARNKPSKVVVGRTMRRQTVILVHLTLNFIAVVLGLLLSIKTALLFVFCISVLWWYSVQLKKQPFWGNLTVAILTGASILLVGYVFDSINEFTLLFTLFSFGITLIREIVKDMEDIEGDKLLGAKTLPIVWGVKKTKYLIIFFSVLFIAFIEYVILPMQGLFFLVCQLIIIPSLVIFVIYLWRAENTKEYKLASKFCKIIMIIGILSIVVI